MVKLVLALVLLQTSCTEPITFEFDLPPDDLVVDGFITDVYKRHLIRLSLSSRLEENVPIKRPVFDATVQIVDDLGNVILLETGQDGDGHFITPFMTANADRAYKIVVNYNGESYESTFEELPTESFAPDLNLRSDSFDIREVIQGSLIIPRRGTSIFAQLQKTDRTVHYQWFVSRCIPDLSNGPLPIDQRYCSVLNNLRKPVIRIYQDLYLEGLEGKEHEYELAWMIPKVSRELVEIDQFLISEKAYNYWLDIKQSVENLDGIFASTPSTIVGNIENMESGESTLGFFGVYREANWGRVVVVD